MPHIVSETITIHLHKLVRSHTDHTAVIDPQQLQALMDTLPTVVEQLMDDASVIVEVDHTGIVK